MTTLTHETGKQSTLDVLACLPDSATSDYCVSFTVTTAAAVGALMAAYPDAKTVVHANGWWSLLHDNFTAMIAPTTMQASR